MRNVGEKNLGLLKGYKMKIFILFLLLVGYSYPQIITNSPMLNFSGGKAGYYLELRAIVMTDDDRSNSVIHKFLHELGHHIWFNGGVDTTAYKNWYKTSKNIWEDFANDHYFYFMGWLNKGEVNYEIFYEFYNRRK